MNLGNILVVGYVVLLVFCAIAAIWDIRSRKIPNWIIFFLAIFWLALAIFSLVQWITGNLNDDITQIRTYFISGLVATVLLCILLVICNWVFKKFSNIKSAIGAGDIKLMSCVALYLGINNILICMLCACILFFIYVVIRSKVKNNTDNTAPFAPFAFIGILIALAISYY